MELTLKMTVQEANLALGYLSKAPYEQVADFIAKIKAQAQAQIDEAEKKIASQEDR